MTRHNVISDMQLGFREEMSTSDTMFEVICEVKYASENNEKYLPIYLDLPKVLDTVPHNELTDVLESYGIRGTVLRPFRNYLFHRIEHVKIQNQSSDHVKIKIGEPHRAVIGSLLFITNV